MYREQSSLLPSVAGGGGALPTEAAGRISKLEASPVYPARSRTARAYLETLKISSDIAEHALERDDKDRAPQQGEERSGRTARTALGVPHLVTTGRQAGVRCIPVKMVFPRAPRAQAELVVILAEIAFSDSSEAKYALILKR